jgi:Uma2 family endonuclease
MPLTKHYVTVDEYYQQERISEIRHDYYDGEIFDMSGGAIIHSRISSNIIIALGNRLKGSPCEVFETNLRLRVLATGLRCYPDVSVCCGPFEIDPEDSQGETVTNPSIVFEVLSPSTEKYDQGFKSENYRKVASLKTYVLVSQTTPYVQAFFSGADGLWTPVEISGLHGMLSLPVISTELSLKEIYERVDFSKSPSIQL